MLQERSAEREKGCKKENPQERKVASKRKSRMEVNSKEICSNKERQLERKAARKKGEKRKMLQEIKGERKKKSKKERQCRGYEIPERGL